jgi:hypothetical protein
MAGFLSEAPAILGVRRHVATFNVPHGIASDFEIGNFQSCATKSANMFAHSKKTEYDASAFAND